MYEFRDLTLSVERAKHRAVRPHHAGIVIAFQVKAGAKGTPCASQDHYLDGSITLNPFKCCGQFTHEFRVQRVKRLRSVEGESQYAVVGPFSQNCAVHARSPRRLCSECVLAAVVFNDVLRDRPKLGAGVRHATIPLCNTWEFTA
jgi:hypothetical protein